MRSLVVLFPLFLVMLDGSVKAADCDEKVTGQIRIDPGHPWRPPFGLDRIGKPLTAVAEIEAAERPYREYWLSAYRGGKEIDRQLFHLTGSHLTGKSPFTGTANFSEHPDELALFARCRFQGEPAEIARLKVPVPGLDAEATARPGGTGPMVFLSASHHPCANRVALHIVNGCPDVHRREHRRTTAPAIDDR